jgi:thiol-disulfide isomerase/thioredoxin
MTTPTSNPVSRRSVFLGAAALAAIAGVGTAWWRGRHEGNAALESVQEPVPGFWSQQWKTPQGQTLSMSSFQGKPLLINFWATWCPPCVEELPLINDFYSKNKSSDWQVLGLAVDSPSPVLKFLEKTPLAFPVAMAAMGGVELGRSLGNLTGGLPFTVVISAQGAVLQRKMGQVHAADLQAWIGLK